MPSSDTSLERVTVVVACEVSLGGDDLNLQIGRRKMRMSPYWTHISCSALATSGQTFGSVFDKRKTAIAVCGNVKILLPQFENRIPALGSLTNIVTGAVPLLQPFVIALML